MSSANRDILTITLPICILFISSSYLIDLHKSFRTILNKSEESGHRVFFLTSGKMVCFSPLSMMFGLYACHK
jgi:hypothetical protein